MKVEKKTKLTPKKKQMGRPLKWTVSKLIEAIEKYFDETTIMEYTLTGLVLAIGSSKQVVNDYEKRKEFRDIIKRAKLMIENSYELSLRKHGRSGDIFALKNFGWKDKQELEHTINPYKHPELKDKTIEELRENAISLAGQRGISSNN